MSDTRLKSYLDRIMRLHEERAGLSADISDIYKEAKNAGYDRKAMVATVKRLMGDPAAFDELDMLVCLYLQAYNGTGTEPAPTRTRAPALTAAPGFDPDTGEIVSKPITTQVVAPASDLPRQVHRAIGGSPLSHSMSEEERKAALEGIPSFLERRRA